jgi:phage gp45-like
VGGDRNNGVVVAVGDRKFRLKGLQGGEVAMYTDEGDIIIMKRGHNIKVKPMQ